MAGSLKDPRTCRIFFSSPFGGMENEREELMRRYFPQIHHLCNSRGLQFVAVDMRWGITTEAAKNAQTINICLRELDRSDMFVGFFGQRYGWHGKEDEALQENFENALNRYPWLDGHRNKSVTELEFLHGHLNHPGELPAVICFRDKAYDSKVREEGEKHGDKKQVFKYSAESENATKMMNDLKRRVWATRDKCLSVHMDYENPVEGSKLMFDAIWKYLNSVLLIGQDTITLSKREITLASHDAFMASRSNLYIGKDVYFEALNASMQKCEPTLVIGGVGSGKSALICNWIHLLQKSEKDLSIIYHYVGCCPGSTSEREVLERLTEELSVAIDEKKSLGKEDQSVGLPDVKSLTEMRTVINNFKIIMEKFSRTGKRAVLVLDGLDKLDGPSKTEKYLYWLPLTFPEGIYFLTSTVTSDIEVQKELVSKRNFNLLEVEALDQAAREELSTRTLLESGKELSPSQLQIIVETEQTQNPLFLKIVLFELSVFGYFRLLDKKIEFLISSQSVTDLFLKVIKRLEEDYNAEEQCSNIVEKVLCSLVVSKNGLSEKELVTIFNIPDHVWSPLYFALEKYILDRSGYIQIAFEELKNAVKIRYITDKKSSDQQIVEKLQDYFEKEVRLTNIQNFRNDLQHAKTFRTGQELAHLYTYTEDLNNLALTLSNIYVLVTYTSSAKYEFLELCSRTGLNGEQFADMVLKSVDNEIVEQYLRNEEYPLLDCMPPGYLFHNCLILAADFFHMAGFFAGQEKLLQRLLRIMSSMNEQYLDKTERDKSMDECKYKLACLYTDCNDLEKAIVLHNEVYNYRKRLWGSGSDIAFNMASSSNGLGLCYLSLKQYDKAEELLLESLELSKYITMDVSNFKANCFMNLGMIFMNNGQLERALQYSEEGLALFEEVYFDHLPLEIGNLLTNIGVIHRRLNNLTLAEETYKRSLEIKRKAVGNAHLSICTSLSNLALILLLKNDLVQAEEYYRECLRIYEVCCVPEEFGDLINVKENLVQTLVHQQRYEDALPTFLNVFSIRMKRNEMDNCLPFVYREMTKHLINIDNYEQAEEILSALMNSKHKSFREYMLMKSIDDLHPGPETAQRSDDYSLENALKQWPDDENLIKTIIVCNLIPVDDIDGIIELITRLEPKYGAMAYDAAVQWFDEVEESKIESKLKVLQIGLTEYPDNMELLLLKAKTFYSLNNYEEALIPLERICEIASDQPSIVKFTADCAMNLEDYVKAKKYYNIFIDRWPDQVDIVEKVKEALDSIDQKEKEGSQQTE